MKQEKFVSHLVECKRLSSPRRIAIYQWFVYFLDDWRAIKMSRDTGTWQVMSRELKVSGIVVSARSADDAISWAKEFKP